ncbi:hypothetical protein NPIL_140751 [Nephila pilipes]|uniref:Uncharacterized protein n=1 Tax=Nephila pilipes TaxID=299642 RepID=A0A8X6MZN6_NEPPI|nr:hypothetical protein NPIL_140751 [Nephila pilipes]
MDGGGVEWSRKGKRAVQASQIFEPNSGTTMVLTLLWSGNIAERQLNVSPHLSSHRFQILLRFLSDTPLPRMAHTPLPETGGKNVGAKLRVGAP